MLTDCGMITFTTPPCSHLTKCKRDDEKQANKESVIINVKKWCEVEYTNSFC